MKRLFSILLISIFVPFIANASDISNGFFVENKTMDFDKTIRSGKCYGTVPYPRLSNADEELFMRINDEIHDFIELYAICNKGKRDNFSVSYDIPEADTKDFFSIRWLTQRDNKLWRIDTLNFNTETGAILKSDDIFNMLGNHMMGEMIKLSEGHLPAKCSWEKFLEKIEKRDIQLYIEDREWYIVFNATSALDKVVDVKIPEYFLIGNRDHDQG